MGQAANPIPAVVLLSLLAAVLPVSGELKTHYKVFNSSFTTQDLQQAGNQSSITSTALQVTIDTDNSNYLPTNLSGRILYKVPFKLWEDGHSRVVSFSTSFLVNLNRKPNFSIPGEGLAFVVAPDLNLPLNSFGEYLGLTNFTTDGSDLNKLIAIELDTFQEHFDPDSNHVGLNINSVVSNKTTSLTPLGFELVGPYSENHYFNIWIEYYGINESIAVYLAPQNQKDDPTPPRPAIPILTSPLDLRQVVNQTSYFGFSASTGNTAQLNCVLGWNLTVEYYYHKDWLKIGLAAGIPSAAFLMAAVGLVYYFRKRWLSRQSDRQMSAKVRCMPGMPREYRFKELQKATNNFDETKKLGQGGYGVVYKGKLVNHDNLEVAVKMFSRESLKGQDDFFDELTIINQLRHKYLVPLQGWCHKHGKLLLVYDYMPNGSLDQHLFSDANSTPLSWNLRCQIIFGVASALHYLHNEYEKRVVHRDIKASNIMLDAKFNPRLGDFGLARALDNENTSYKEANGVPGTRGYMAPEYVFLGKATEQSDVYAFGAVLLEVVCGRRPWTQIGEYPSLVDWVWALHREGRLLEALDKRLGEDNVAEEAGKFLLLGLACSHSTANERPKAHEIVQILSGSVPVPLVPPFKPPYVLSSVSIGEEDTSQATTIDTTSFGMSDHELISASNLVFSSGSMREEDISEATTTDTTSFGTAPYGQGSTPLAIN